MHINFYLILDCPLPVGVNEKFLIELMEINKVTT